MHTLAWTEDNGEGDHPPYTAGGSGYHGDPEAAPGGMCRRFASNAPRRSAKKGGAARALSAKHLLRSRDTWVLPMPLLPSAMMFSRRVTRISHAGERLLFEWRSAGVHS
jgi:hypothetical protein